MRPCSRSPGSWAPRRAPHRSNGSTRGMWSNTASASAPRRPGQGASQMPPGRPACRRWSRSPAPPPPTGPYRGPSCRRWPVSVPVGQERACTGGSSGRSKLRRRPRRCGREWRSPALRRQSRSHLHPPLAGPWLWRRSRAWPIQPPQRYGPKRVGPSAPGKVPSSHRRACSARPALHIPRPTPDGPRQTAHARRSGTAQPLCGRWSTGADCNFH